MENVQKIVEKFVKSKTPEGTEIVLLSVIGSRGKNLASKNSDYDCKVIVLHPKREYLLQKVKNIKRYETILEEENQELEITIISLLQMNQWCLESNPSANDILYTPIQRLKVQ